MQPVTGPHLFWADATLWAKPVPALATVVNTEHLRAASLEVLAEYKDAQAAVIEASDALEATLTLEQRALWKAAKEAEAEERGSGDNLEYSELMRHLPGLAPLPWALRADHPMGWFHNVGVCCTPGLDDQS